MLIPKRKTWGSERGMGPETIRANDASTALVHLHILMGLGQPRPRGPATFSPRGFFSRLALHCLPLSLVIS